MNSIKKWGFPLFAGISLLLCGIVCCEVWRGAPVWFFLATVDSPAEIVHEADHDFLVGLIRQITMTPTLILGLIAIIWITVAIILYKRRGSNN